MVEGSALFRLLRSCLSSSNWTAHSFEQPLRVIFYPTFHFILNVGDSKSIRDEGISHRPRSANHSLICLRLKTLHKIRHFDFAFELRSWILPAYPPDEGSLLVREEEHLPVRVYFSRLYWPVFFPFIMWVYRISLLTRYIPKYPASMTCGYGWYLTATVWKFPYVRWHVSPWLRCAISRAILHSNGGGLSANTRSSFRICALTMMV